MFIILATIYFTCLCLKAYRYFVVRVWRCDLGKLSFGARCQDSSTSGWIGNWTTTSGALMADISVTFSQTTTIFLLVNNFLMLYYLENIFVSKVYNFTDVFISNLFSSNKYQIFFLIPSLTGWKWASFSNAKVFKFCCLLKVENPGLGKKKCLFFLVVVCFFSCEFFSHLLTDFFLGPSHRIVLEPTPISLKRSPTLPTSCSIFCLEQQFSNLSVHIYLPCSIDSLIH